MSKGKIPIIMKSNSIFNILKGSERSVKAKKNILEMFLLKGGNILIGLLMVPLTINYVDSENYGIWLTLSSMVAWMSFFNIGLNNGLKNKLCEALANNDFFMGRKYVSTTYALLFIIFIPLMMLLLIVVPYVDWYSLLNVSESIGKSLLASICILVVYFSLNFILSTIEVVLQADQNPAYGSLLNFIQQLISLVIIGVLTLTTEGDLLNLCIALCAAPLFISCIFNVLLFTGKYKRIAPTFSGIDFKVVPSLLNLGLKFFVIQIAGIVQYQMSNFLILKYIGASEVTIYNIAYRYISVLWMVWSIMTTPIWAAVTDAIAKEDYEWIKNVQKRYLKFLFLFTVVGVVMVVISPIVYNIWIGDKMVIPSILTAFVFVYIWVMMFGNVYVSILNGAGLLNLQMYSCLVSPLVFIGVFFVCSNMMDMGIISVLIASILSNFNGFLVAPMQCRQFIKKECNV